jgi:putative transcriptional regulator
LKEPFNVAISVKLDDLLHDRRMTLTELADRIGITLANLSILKTGKARAIRFSTLEAICQALSCQPGDILRCEPDQPETDPPVAAVGNTSQADEELGWRRSSRSAARVERD